MTDWEMQRVGSDDPGRGDSGPEGLDIWGYLRVVRRRWLTVLSLVALALGLTGFVTLRMTKIYRATTTIRIETQAPQVLGHSVEDVVEMGTGSFWSNLEYYETQYKIIESRDVASRVVRELNLNEDPAFVGKPSERGGDASRVSVDAAAEKLQSLLTVEPVKDSRLVKIHVDDPNPERARLYANAIARAYVEQNLESMLRGTVDAVDWLAKQLDDAQGKLVASEEAIQRFRKENDILSVSLEERQNILTAQMTAAATKLAEAQADRIAISARKAAIEKVSNAGDPMAIPLQAINASPLIQQFKQEYGKLSQQYGELSERYGENFPAMKELQARLERIRGDITREVKNVLRSVDAELVAAQSTEAGLQKVLDVYRNQALALTQKETTYNRLDRDRRNNEKIYELLLGRSKEAGLSKLLQVNNVHVLDPALVPKVPIKPKLGLNLLLALLVGLLAGLGLAIVLEYMDRTLKTQDDVELLGIAFLGIVPSIDTASIDMDKNGRGARSRSRSPRGRGRKRRSQAGNGSKPINYDTFVHEYPKSQVAESCRSIRTNLLFMSADSRARRILITSPSPQEGKTTVAVNLAITMAQSGSRVLLVDTDMRRPRVHRAFNQTRQDIGLSTMILGETTADQAICRTPIPNLDILPCGPTPPNPAELMLTDRFAQLVDELAGRYERLIFDSPPVGVVTDAAVLSKLVDGTVLIIKSLGTTRDAAKHAIGVLRDIEAHILGAVLNELDLTNRKYGQHYYYYYYKEYGHYYGAPETGDGSESRTGDRAPAETGSRA